MIRLLLLLFASLVVVERPASNCAAQNGMVDFTDAADRLQQATVTLRFKRPIVATETDAGDGSVDESVEQPEFKPQSEVTILSGVFVDAQMIVAPLPVRDTSQLRFTRSDGTQGTAFPIVIDEFTGLSLLATEDKSDTSVVLADDLPAAGAWILSASAWGTERPLISYGIVSARQRQIQGTRTPNLMMCDLRATDTSTGAPIVDSSGKLVGITIAASADRQQGWTYAIPVRHVKRMMRTWQQQLHDLPPLNSSEPQSQDKQSQTAEKKEPISSSALASSSVIVIPHRRPIVGMILEDDGANIVVVHLTPDGPASKAGVQLGDQVTGVAGVQIRSVYQAVLPTFHYQPGDVLRYQVTRQDQPLEIDITLGGDVVLPATSLSQIDELIQPAIRIRLNEDESIATLTDERSWSEIADDLYFSSREHYGTANAFIEPEATTSPRRPTNAVQTPQLDRNSDSQVNPEAVLESMQRALARCQEIIELQSEALKREQSARQEDRQRIETLEAELKDLKMLLRKDGTPSQTSIGQNVSKAR